MSSSSAMRTMQSSTAGASGRPGRYWKPSEVASCSAVLSSMQQRLASFTARMTTGRSTWEVGTGKVRLSGLHLQPRRAKNRWGKHFVSFLPAMSTKAAKAIRATIREWRMASTRNNQHLEDLARLVNPAVRGWMNYYGRFYRSKCVQVLRHLDEEALAAWARRKYRRFWRRERASMHWLGRIARRDRTLFAHWEQGVLPDAGS